MDQVRYMELGPYSGIPLNMVEAWAMLCGHDLDLVIISHYTHYGSL